MSEQTADGEVSSACKRLGLTPRELARAVHSFTRAAGQECDIDDPWEPLHRFCGASATEQRKFADEVILTRRQHE